MKTLALRSALLLGLIAVPLSWAQTAPQGSAPAAGASAEHPMHGRMMERMKARQGQHLSQLKAKLQLKAEQEPAWSAFAGAMSPPERPPARPDWAEVMRLNTPERIDRMKALHQQRHTEMTAMMERRGEAAKTFYAQLSAEQKKVFDDETRQHMARWGGPGRPGERGGHNGHHSGHHGSHHQGG